MKYKIKFTEQAERDLHSIFEYIAYELLSVQTAVKQIEQLKKNILSLDCMPERFRRYDKEPWKSRGLRVMPVNNYIVFFIPNHETETVTVIRIMYGGRDIDRVIGTI